MCKNLPNFFKLMGVLNFKSPMSIKVIRMKNVTSVIPSFFLKNRLISLL